MNLRKPNIRDRRAAILFLQKSGLGRVAVGTSPHPITGQMCKRVWVTKDGPWAPGSGKTLVQAARSFQRFAVNR